ncbi:MAG: histidine--tRNA ligase [Bdellovibrionales bacterium]|nr:histidine--tRNA ligase [Bdellovibrionales bacterium]
MQKTMQKVRGTQDWLSDQSYYFRSLEAQFYQKAAAYGFGEVKTPIFEHSEVFHRTLGETSDVVSKETYTFLDRSDESLTLRPEGTAGIARCFISEGLAQKIPLKLYYCGPMFRYERPQKGRLRQFHQLGIEVLGLDSPSVDVECLQLGQELLKTLGISEKCSLQLNTLGDMESRIAYKEALVTYYQQYVNDLSAESKVRLEKNPLRILDSKDAKDIEINQSAPKLIEHLNEASKNYFDTLLNLLNQLGLKYELNNKLVRGLDYYCHTVFEYVTKELGAQGTVLAGGRYDGLIEMMGGPKTPGVGWAAGIERLVELADKEKLKNSPQVISLIAADPEGEVEVLKLATDLRALNFKSAFVFEIIYGGNVGKKMKKAANKNSDWVVIIGNSEIQKKVVMAKNMKTGQQQEVSNTVEAIKQLFEGPK